MFFCYRLSTRIFCICVTRESIEKMTSTKTKENVITMTITNSLIKKATKSCTLSKRYINIMLRTTVINIIYHRLNIDEREFQTKKFNNVSFQTCRSRSKNPVIRDFHIIMQACKDAIEKSYLKNIYLYLVESKSGDILETYKFVFKYADENNQEYKSQYEGKLTETTGLLLMALGDLRKCQKFKSEVYLKVELTYMDDTPEEYEPPGFRSVDEPNAFVNTLKLKERSIVFGKVCTGFHQLSCMAKGGPFHVQVSNSSSEEDTNETGGSQIKINSQIFTEDFSQPVGLQENIGFNTSSNDMCQSKINDTYVSHCGDVISTDGDADINCLCELPTTVGNWSADVVECETCMRKYHAACQGYIDKTFMGETFQCETCESDRGEDNIFGLGDRKFVQYMSRVRYLMSCHYLLSKIPPELTQTYQDAQKKMKETQIFNSWGNNPEVLKRNLTSYIFKFQHRKPNMSRFGPFMMLK